MATVSPSPLTPPPGLTLDSLTHIDITTLSQSELHSLSLCAPSSFDLRRTHDLVFPKIDRSIFNESAGSRRQTYSRPRKSQFFNSSSSPSAAAASGHRRRVAGLLPTHKLPQAPPDDPERIENLAIINYLKNYIVKDPKFDGVEFNSPISDSVTVNPRAGHGSNWDFSMKEVSVNGIGSLMGFTDERKRKRGRKPKVHVHLEEDFGGDLQIVNKNGVQIDLNALANVENPFGEEVRKRTAGLESEEDLLGFMRELSGQWGSRRKRRRIVEANEFGDALPIGWKLILGIKRKEGRAWIYCRRYLSPTGQQFITCKEVSAFLQSFFGGSNSGQRTNSQKVDTAQLDRPLMSANPAAFNHTGENQKQDISSSSKLPNVFVSSKREKEVSMLAIENLADVQIHDLFECHKCSMTFDEKDLYLQHLLSFHQRTTRRYRLGSSVGDGVIIKDGKYECQFCHKVFLERRRYNGHVGIHVRNYVRKVEESPGQMTNQNRVDSPMRNDELPLKITKMDALIEIAQNSILETSTSASLPEKLNIDSMPKTALANTDEGVNFGSPLSEQEMEDSLTDEALDQQDSENTFTDENTDKVDYASDVLDVSIDSCFGKTNLLSANDKNSNSSVVLCVKDGVEDASGEIFKSGIQQEDISQSPLFATSVNESNFNVENDKNLLYENNLNLNHPGHDIARDKGSKLENGCGKGSKGSVDEVVKKSFQQEEEVVQSGAPEPSMFMVPSPHCFTTFSVLSDKGEEEFNCADQNRENITGFEELRFEEIETLDYNYTDVQESLSLPEVHMNSTNSAETERLFSSSSQFESEEVMAGTHQLTTVCVWCGIEFTHEALDSDIQSDTVGFMCPTCKAKISGQLGVLDGSSSMNP